jgi:hypothetical protein
MTLTNSQELYLDCLENLEQLASGITNLEVDATHDPSQSPWIRVLSGLFYVV